MAVTATRTTSLFTDANGDGKITPGDTLLTEILLKNATASPLTTVTINDSLTSNTTYVAGSTVVTTGDSYSLTGNTPITFGTAQGLLANDYHFDGVNAGTNTGLVVATVNNTAIGAPITVFDAANNALTAGTVNVAADGSFTFTPATGYTGTASFSYTDSDGSGTVGHGTVNLAVNGLVWYVDSGASAAGADGSYLHPFTTLAPVSGVDHTNDTIVLHGTVTGGITLKTGETFYGDGSTFSVNGHQITSAGSNSIIQHSAVGITLGQNNTIDGINLAGTGTNAVGIQDGNGTVGTLNINHMAITGLGQIADIDQGGVLNVTLSSANSNGFVTAAAGAALDLEGTSGSFTVSGTTSILSSQVGGGIKITGSLAATFSGATSVDTTSTNTAGVTVGGTATTSFAGLTVTTGGGAAVTMSGGGLTVTGASNSITTTTGAGLTTTGGTLNIASGSISSTTGHLVDMTNTTVGTVALSSLTDSSSVVGSAIKFDNVDGGTFGATSVSVAGASGDGLHIGTGSSTAFTFGNTTIAGISAGNQGIDISGNTTAAGAANVTFNGTVNVNTAANATNGVVIDGNNGGVAFTGTSVTVNSGNGNAVTISNNSAAVSFTGGGLNVDTTGGTAFSATQGTGTGGSLNISAGAGGVNTNSIVSTTGRAVNIDSVTSTVDLHDVSAGGGSTTAIFVRNTGAGGHFIITGTGTTAASGGTISNISGADGTLAGQATAGTGVYLENVSNVSLANMNFTGTFTNFGIRGESVNNFTLKDSNLTGTFGNNVGLGEDAIRFGTQGTSTGLTGTALFSGDVIQGGKEHNLSDYTYGSNTLNMTIQDSAAHQAVFNANDATNGANDVIVETGGTSNLTFASTGVTYTGSHDTNLDILSLAQTTQNITISGNTFANTQTQTSGAANIRISGSLQGGTVHYTIDTNTLKGANGSNIFASFNGTSGTVTGHITNNITGTPNGVYDSTLANTGSLNGGLFFGGIDGKQSSAGTFKYDLNISGNTVADHNSVAGAIVIRSSADDNTGVERVEATIASNTFEEGGPNMNTGNVGAIYLQPAGSSLTAYGTIGVDIKNNNFNLTGNTNASGLIVDGTNGSNVNLYMPGISPSGTTSASVIASYLAGKGNTFTNTNPNVGYFAGFGVNNTALQDAVPLMTTAPNQGLGWEDLLPPVKTPSDPTVTTSPTDTTGGSGTGGTGTGSTGGDTTPAPTPPPVVTDALTQSALDQMVAAAIHRWELAGATPDQLAAMKAVSVTLANISGLIVGDSTAGHIQVSANAAGYGWFVDATPDEDSEFAGTGSDLTAAAGSAAAGHVDLLTVLEHELGHQIGLSDSYSPNDVADLMYGYVNPGERRLATGDDVHAASGTPVDHESFALAPVTIPSLAANTNVDVSFRSTVNAFSAGLAPTLTGSSSITWQGNAIPLTTSETTNNVNTSRTDSGGTVTTAALAEATLTLGNLVFKDNDKDGQFGAGDTGIGNVTVKLYVDTNANGVYDAGVDTFVATTTTSNVAGTLGQYSFTGLAPGDYVVVIPASNFGAGVLGALVPHNGALDPDNNVDNDNNGSNVAGGDVASQAITLAYDTEVTNGAGNDTNNTLDFGFQVNTPPVANADTLTATDEDTPATYAASAFTGNDSDPDGDTFTITAVGNGSHGTAVLNGNGTVTYTPNADYNGPDSFSYTITDSHGASTVGTANVTVNAVNDPVHTSGPGAATFLEDSSNTTILSASGTAFSISDVDATLAPSGVYEVTISATHGTLTMTTLTGLGFTVGDGTADTSMTFHGTLSDINTALATARYTPDANYAGAATITIHATDTYGNVVATGTGSATQDGQDINVTVTSVNDAPVVTDESATTNDTTDHVFTSGDFTAHFTDPNDSPANNPLNVIITSLPSTGTLTYNGTAITLGQLPYTVSLTDIGNGLLHYHPAAASGGSDYTFGFEVQDDGGTANSGHDTSAPQTFTMHVTVSNFPPVVDLDSTAAGTGTSVTFLENQSIQVAPNATVTDSDSPDFNGGSLTVAYHSGGTADDYFSAQDEGGAFVSNNHIGISGTGVYYNQVQIGTITSQGLGNPYVVTFNSNATAQAVQALVQDIHVGSASDTPPGGSRTVDFTVTDGDGGSTTVNADVTITSVNDAPVAAANNSVTTNEDTAAAATAIGATDADGDTLSYSVKAGTDPAKGMVTFDQANGTFTYTPNTNANGSDSFTILIDDSHGGTTEQAVSVTINPVNDAPTYSGATAGSTSEDGAITFSSGGGNAIVIADPESGTESYTATLTVGHGVLAATAAGAAQISGGGTDTLIVSGSLADVNATLDGLTYTPAADYNGVDTLHISTHDDGGMAYGGVDTAAIDIALTVSAVNDAPVVVNGDTAAATTIAEDTPSSTGDTVSSLFASHFSDAADQVAGGSSADSFAGVAVTGNDTSGTTGQWQYYDGASWVDVGTVSDGAALLLDASTPLRFSPAQDYNGAAPTLTVHLVDSSAGSVPTGSVADLSAAGATGGTSAYSSGTIGLGDTVTAVDDNPVLATTGTSFDYTENDPAHALFTSLAVSDVDNADFNGGQLTIADASGDPGDGIAFGSNPDIVIDQNAGTVSYQGNVFANVSPSAPGSIVLDLNGYATPAAIQALLGVIEYVNTSDDPIGGDHAITVTLTDGAGGSANFVTHVNVIPVNDNPSIANLDGDTVTYVENDQIAYLDTGTNVAPNTVAVPGPGNALVTDPDSHDFNGATLTVAVSGNKVATEDRILFSFDTVNTPGQISVIGANVFYGSTQIGTLNAGGVGVDRVVTFNANATAAMVDAVIHQFGYANTSDNPSTLDRTISFTLTDGDGGATVSHTTVHVTAVNDNPVLDLNPSTGGTGTNNGLFEQDPSGSGGIAYSATLTDVDSPNFDTGTLTVSITANGQGGDQISIINNFTDFGNTHTVTTSGNQVLFDNVVVGTFTAGDSSTPLSVTFNANATPLAAEWVLRAVDVTFTADDPSSAVRTLHYVVTDGDGGSASADATYNVTAANDAPQLTAPTDASVSFTENNAAVAILQGVVLSDPDNPASFSTGSVDINITGTPGGINLKAGSNFTIHDNGNNTYTLMGPGNVAIGDITGFGTTHLQVTNLTSNATLAVLNDLIDDWTFSIAGDDVSDANGTITLTFNDGHHTGYFGDGALTATQTQSLDVTGLNDAPVNNVPVATQAATEDGSLTFNSGNSNLVSISDPDDDGGSLTVTVAVAHGTLTLSGTANLSFSTGDGSGDATMTFSGTKADINAALDGLVYTPAGDFNGNDTLTITTNDNGNSGDGPAGQDVDTVAIHVNAVNDAPVASGSATAPAIDEDSPSATGNTVGGLFAGNYSDAADNQSAYGGSSAGAMGGIAITGNASGAAGQWQYWDGAGWVDVGAVSDSSALTLSAGTALRFTPAANYNGAAPELTVHLADDTVSITDGAHVDLSGVGATGGTTAWSSATVVLDETVNAVNDPPVLDLNGAGAGTSSTLNYTEAQTYQPVAPSATVSDVDSPNFDNGVLTLAFTANGTSDDQLAIIDHGVMHTGDISISDNAIYYQFGSITATGDPNNPYDYSNSDIRFIGTFAGGTGGSDLSITFNDQVTPAIAQAVLADIGYENISNNPSTLARTVTVTLAESDGTTSSPTTVTINVTAIDTPAVIQSDLASTDEAHSVNIAVLANDSDPDGPPPTVAKINGQNVVPGQTIVLTSGALATLNADGTITYDPYHKFDTTTSTSGGEIGASNTQAVDSFTYASADGSTGTVTVSIDGVAGPGDWLRGSDGNDTITGTGGNDLFMLLDGGNDTANGLGGNDAFYYGAALTAADENDGGAGRDVVILQGDYWGPNKLTLGLHNLDNIEAISLQSGSVTRWGDTANHLYSYDITTIDANVGAGQQMIVNGSALLAGENFTFNGSAETNGTFLVYGGFGTDHLTGGAGNDVFFFDGDRWNSTDTIDGGGGRDVVVVTGSSTGINHIVVGSGQLVNVEAFSVSPVYAINPAVTPSYDIVLNDGNTPAGGSLIVNAGTLTAAIQTFALDAHTVTGDLWVFGGAGADTIVTGSGNDVIVGGGGADNLTGGAGLDLFQYNKVSDSTAQAPDHILDFTSGSDKIDLRGIDANPATAGDDAFVWSNDGTFHGISGEVREFYDAGHGWWVLDGDVDGDGQADFTIHITTTANAPLVHSDVFL